MKNLKHKASSVDNFFLFLNPHLKMNERERNMSFSFQNVVKEQHLCKYYIQKIIIAIKICFLQSWLDENKLLMKNTDKDDIG